MHAVAGLRFAPLVRGFFVAVPRESMIIKGFRVGPLLKKTGKEILDDNVLGLAAEVAYNFLFSLFPLFLFAAPLIGLIGNEQATLNWAMQQLATVVPPDAYALVRGII